MSRLSNLSVLKKSVNDKHGKGTIDMAVNSLPTEMQRLSTGSLAFDYAIGGGIPAGRITMFWGSESSGKSTSAFRIAGLAQRLCANCLREPAGWKVVEDIDESSGEVNYRADAVCDCYAKGLVKPRVEPHEKTAQGTLKSLEVEYEEDGKVKKRKTTEYDERIRRYETNSFEEFRVAMVDVEGTYDIDWGNILGLDERLLVYMRPQNAEEAIDVYSNLLFTGAVNLVILDSIAHMAPSDEILKSTTEWQQGLGARLFNKWNRITGAAMNSVWREYGYTPTQIWINQERIDIQKKFGSKKIKPGGNAQRFSPSLEVYMWASSWKNEDMDADLKEGFRSEIGSEVLMNFKVEKNKTYAARATGSYTMSVLGETAGDIIELPYVVAMSEKHGLIRKESATKWFLGEEEFKTKSALMEKMQRPAVMKAIKRTLLRKMLYGKRREAVK